MRTAIVFTLSSLLIACSATPEQFSPLSQQDLQHHHWVLESINGQTLQLSNELVVPTLEIGEHFTANGFNGCNRYFGQAELKGAQFRVDKLASTKMSCPARLQQLEMTINQVLGHWSRIELSPKKRLTLTNGSNRLDFALRDWVY